MYLRYVDEGGQDAVYELADNSVLIGRGEDVDVCVTDHQASRSHCEIRLWAGSHVLKDLNTPNGTRVNGQPVQVAQLKVGDEICIGTTVLKLTDTQHAAGESTAIREIDDEMAQGKGYGTILRKIVHDIDDEKDDPKQD